MRRHKIKTPATSRPSSCAKTYLGRYPAAARIVAQAGSCATSESAVARTKRVHAARVRSFGALVEATASPPLRPPGADDR
jgi:hypothetical protein